MTVSSEVAVRTDEMLIAVERLCRMDSPSNDVALLHGCAGELDELVFELTGVRSEAQQTADGRPLMRFDFGERPDVLMIGHLDTVYSAGTAEGSLRREGDLLYGHGTMDMKGGLVIMATAVAEVMKTMPTPNITMLVNSDEELGSPVSRDLIRQLSSEAGAVLVFEFTDPSAALKVGRRGIRQYRLHLRGKGAHAAYPEKANNPVVALGQLLTEIASYGQHDELCVTPTRIVSSDRTNVIPDEVTLDLDVRSSSERLMDGVAGFLSGLRSDVPGIEVHVEALVECPAYEPDPHHWLLDIANHAAAELGLAPMPAITARGASDANTAASVNGRVLDGLGAPGDGAHLPGREHLIVSQLVPRAELTASILSTLLAPKVA